MGQYFLDTQYYRLSFFSAHPFICLLYTYFTECEYIFLLVFLSVRLPPYSSICPMYISFLFTVAWTFLKKNNSKSVRELKIEKVCNRTCLSFDPSGWIRMQIILKGRIYIKKKQYEIRTCLSVMFLSCARKRSRFGPSAVHRIQRYWDLPKLFSCKLACACNLASMEKKI